MIGHKDILKVFESSIDGNYIFKGINGIGKMKLAWKLAYKYCKSVDILSPKSFGINDIRETVQWGNKNPYCSPFKITIIDGDKLTLPAQQAILKFLEESPAKTRVIIVSSRNNLLDTVVSRCRTIKFLPLSSQEVLKVLLSLGYKEKEVTRAVDFSGGSVSRALEIINDKDKIDKVIIFINFINANKLEGIIPLVKTWGDKEIYWLKYYILNMLSMDSYFPDNKLCVSDVNRILKLLDIPMKPSLKGLYVGIRLLEGV